MATHNNVKMTCLNSAKKYEKSKLQLNVLEYFVST
jgi:hypothetical protein